jgi:hypothetical protein
MFGFTLRMTAAFVAALCVLFFMWSLNPKKQETQIKLTRQDLAGVTFWPRKSDLRAVAQAKGCGAIVLPASLLELGAEEILAVCK